MTAVTEQTQVLNVKNYFYDKEHWCIPIGVFTLQVGKLNLTELHCSSAAVNAF